MSEWVCMSMKPGVTARPAASIRVFASAARRSSSATIRPPSTATSARRGPEPVPSITLPF
jgi:hypothetical protein